MLSYWVRASGFIDELRERVANQVSWTEILTVMTNHLWLVWYRAQSPTGPKHWSLFVTYDTDEEAMGTIYQVRTVSTTCSLARPWKN